MDNSYEDESLIGNKTKVNENSSSSQDISETKVEIPKKEEFSYSKMFSQLFSNIISSLMWYSIMLIEVFFIGQTQNITLQAAVHLGFQFCNIFSTQFVFGLADSINFICAKSFGRKNYNLVGVQINQIRFMVFVYQILFSIFSICFSHKIIELIAGTDQPYIKDAHIFILYSIPSMILEVQYEISCRHCLSISFYTPLLVSLTCGSIIHPINCWIFIIYLNKEVNGVVISQIITQIVKLFTISLVFWLKNPFPETSQFINLKMFDKSTFIITFTLAFIGAISFYADATWAPFTSLVISSTNEIFVNKFVVVFSIITMHEIVSISFMNTLCTLISQSLGANNPEMIRKTIKVILFIGLCSEICLDLFIGFFRVEVIRFYSDNEIIYSDTDFQSVIILVAILNVFDFFVVTLMGIYRGVGYIKTISLFCILFQTIGMPLSAYILTNIYSYGIREMIISFLLIYPCFIITATIFMFFEFNLNNICKESYLLQIEEEKNFIKQETETSDELLTLN